MKPQQFLGTGGGDYPARSVLQRLIARLDSAARLPNVAGPFRAGPPRVAGGGSSRVRGRGACAAGGGLGVHTPARERDAGAGAIAASIEPGSGPAGRPRAVRGLKNTGGREADMGAD